MKQNYDLEMNIAAEKIYRRGKWRLILPIGLIAGVLMFFCMTVIEYFQHPGELHGVWLFWYVAIALPIECGFGMIAGWLYWRKIKRRALRAEKPV
ncbi:MAG: hypothetical protein WA414_02265 [Acidobacteriaceae bacterium]